MTKRKDLVLTKNTVIDGDLTCGDICCEGGRWSLTVHGNINARDITAGDIDARDITARDIDAGDIVCVSRKKEAANAKTIAYSIVLDRWNRERMEVMPEAEKVTR